MHQSSMSRWLLVRALSLLALMILTTPFGFRASASAQSSLTELDNKLKSQHAAIEEEIVLPPSRVDHPHDYREVLREWQNSLASRFSDAAATVEEIIKIDPANAEMWRERLETLRLYSQPISPPRQRTVFGQGEVQKRARVLDAPAAFYTDAARANGTRGEVRLRLVLAADGSVKNVFPIKSLHHGLTESAMTAARQIKFEPATRNEAPVSQFATFVYEFRKKDAKPYIPRTVF
ncbi:MAG: energy transducer TonB [Acidobacteriota bacterium]